LRINDLRAARQRLLHTPAAPQCLPSIAIRFSSLREASARLGSNCVRPWNHVRSLTAFRVTE